MVNRYRNYQPTQYTVHSKSHRALFLMLGIVILGGGTVIWYTLKKNSHQDTTNSQSVKAITSSANKQSLNAKPITSTTWNELNQKLTSQINENPDIDIGVALIDLNADTKADYGVQQAFTAASTTKVLTAMAFLHEVELSQQTLSETINDMSAGDQLKNMINQSNNDSWAALNTRIGYSTLASYARSIGIQSFNVNGNTITAADEALLLQKLYNGNLLTSTHRSLLLSYMQNTNNEIMIPQVLPTGATIYHKYGLLDGHLHDAAIIEYKDRPIVLVIYTKGSDVDQANVYNNRVALIRQLATTVITTFYSSL